MAKKYSEYTKEELKDLYEQLLNEYNSYKELKLSLDMSRGKPAPAQLDLCNEVEYCLNGVSLKTESGVDCRNYGGLDGIPEAKKLMADMVGTRPENVIVQGNSSLNIMYDSIARSFTHGVMGMTPWSKLDKVKFLCVVPGYDRHFAITEFFGCENIAVPMLEDGPCMDTVRKYVENDESVKGIWCVPKYSNPTGNTYSEKVVKELASLKPAAEDFRIYWDNAYVVHDLYDEHDELPDIISECEKAGNKNMVYEFVSTSKISFAGSGISAVISSDGNIKDIMSKIKYQTIGHDKINQLRHVRYFKDIEGIKKHMKVLADYLRPKFEAVDEILTSELEGTGIATWTKPLGGYFISFDVMKGCAKEVVKKCKEAGVVLTNAGATFPGGADPDDTNIRIAPSYPEPEDLKKAAKLLCLCTKLVGVEKLLNI